MPDRQPDPVQTTGGTAPSGHIQQAALDAVAAIAESYLLRGGQPGLAYGIVAGGSLVHSGGLGESWLGGPEPAAGTVFRIASMTKSFTAAAVLALRDDGALALDDPAADYVPELRGLSPVTGDSPRISVRHLLTMTAGFPTDDPWGDRQQGTPLGEFAELLAGGVRFAWAPGTRFEYANIGYAILGLVISAVSGAAYPDFVRDRLLRPLGMTSTGFEAAEFDPARLARGYRRSAAGWEELIPDPAGAFAPMGGVFSSVADLARWARRLRQRVPAGCRRRGRLASAAPGVPPGHAAAAGRAAAAAALVPGRVRPRQLRLRPLRRGRPGARPGRPAQRRLPGVRQPHALAPGHRDRRDRAGERNLRARAPDGGQDAGRAAGIPARSGPAGRQPGCCAAARSGRSRPAAGRRPGARPAGWPVAGDAGRAACGHRAAPVLG